MGLMLYCLSWPMLMNGELALVFFHSHVFLIV